MTETRRTPPDLPRRLVDLTPAVTVGSLAWAAGLGVLLVLRYLFDREVGVWLPTTIAGVGLGLLGMAVITWQRSASRGGSRGAQRGL